MQTSQRYAGQQNLTHSGILLTLFGFGSHLPSLWMEEQKHKVYWFIPIISLAVGAMMDDCGIISHGTFVEDLFLWPWRLHQSDVPG